jgi:hypothetical protein
MLNLSISFFDLKNFCIELYKDENLLRSIVTKKSIQKLKKNTLEEVDKTTESIIRLFDSYINHKHIDEKSVTLVLSNDTMEIYINLNDVGLADISVNFNINKSLKISTKNIKQLTIHRLHCEELYLNTPLVIVSGWLETNILYSDYEIENTKDSIAYINKIDGKGRFINYGILNMDILKGVSSGAVISILKFENTVSSLFTTISNLTVVETNTSFEIGENTELRVGGILHFEGYGLLNSNTTHSFILRGCVYSKSANIYRTFFNYGNFYSSDLNQVGKLENIEDSLLKVDNLTTRWYYTNFGEIDIKNTYHNANCINKGAMKCSTLKIPHSKYFRNEGELACNIIDNEGEFLNLPKSVIKCKGCDEIHYHHKIVTHTSSFMDVLNCLVKGCVGKKLIIYIEESIIINKSFENYNIDHIQLNIKGDCTFNEEFKTNGITLNIEKKLTINKELWATNGILHIVSDSLECKKGKLYGKDGICIKNNTLSEIGDFIPNVIETENDATYSRNARNDSYIASIGSIHISSYEINLHYGNITSLEENIFFKTSAKFLNTCGLIRGKDITIKAVEYIHTRDKTIFYLEPNRVYHPLSGPAIIEAINHIIFRKCTLIKNSMSNLICGGNLLIKNCGNSHSLKENSSYIEEIEPYAGLYRLYRCCSQTGKNGRCYWMNPCDHNFDLLRAYTWGCKTQTGESIQINMGNIVLSGNLNSSIISLSSTKSTFRNGNTSRKELINPNSIEIDMNQFIKKEIRNDGLFIEYENGEITTPFIKNYRNVKSDRIFNPLRSLDLNIWIQRALSEFAGKSYICDIFKNKIGGKNLYQKLMEGNVVVPGDVPKIYTLEDDSIQKTILHIPKEEINAYQSPGDIVCEEFSSLSEKDQIHSNTRVIASESLQVISENGNIHRQTEKYGMSYIENGTQIYTEVAYPQQTFICSGGVKIEGKNLYNTGVATIAGGIIEESTHSDNGCISKSPLVLNTRTYREWTKSGWVSSKTYSESTSYSTSIPTQTISMKSLSEKSKSIYLVGAVEQAVESIEYDSGTFISKPCIMHHTQISTTQTQGMMSKGYSINEVSTPYFIPSEIHARNIIFKSIDCTPTLYGTRISAKRIRDGSRKGLSFSPSIAKGTYSQKVYQKSPTSTIDTGNSGWKEVMFPCNVNCEKIIRDIIDNGYIIFDSVIFENKPQIMGKCIETYYTLKSYHEEYNDSSQAIPDAFIAIAALAISFYTMGMGATLLKVGGILGCMANAAVTSVLVNASVHLLKTGDIFQVAESFFTKEYLQSLGISIASAGILGDPSTAYSSFLNRLGDNAVRNVVNASISKVIANEKFVSKNIVKNTLIQSISGEVANKIGGKYKDSKFHRQVSHFVLGSAIGFAKNGNTRSMFAGGLGVLASELLADYLLENEILTNPLKASQYSTLLSASGCAFVKGDVSSTIQTSINAFENNRMMHISTEGKDSEGKDSEGREKNDEDNYSDFIEDEIQGYIFPEKKIKKMIYTFEKKKYTDSEFSETYFLSSDYDNLQEKWQTVDSPLGNIKKVVDKSMYNFSNIPNKSWSDLFPHEYFGLAPVYTLKAINATDNFFGGYLQKGLHGFSKCTKDVGNFTRDVTFYISNNAILSQDIGYTTTFVLDMFLPVKALSTLSKMKGAMYLNKIMSKSPMGTYTPSHISNVEKWSVKDISASTVINFNKGDKLFPLINKRIVRKSDAPILIYGHGCEVDIALKSEKLIVPAPSFTRKFENSISRDSYQQILSKRVDPKRSFPVSITKNINKKIEVIDIDVNHRMLAKYIQKLPNSKKEIGLYSCSVGSKNFSQNLSNKLNAVVHAPTKFLNIDYLMGTFDVVDCWYAKGIPKINKNGPRGILKTFLPGGNLKDLGAMCIIPVIPSTVAKHYYGPGRPAVVKNDEIVPFVKDGKEGVWKKGCISNDMNLTSRTSNVSKMYERLKEKGIIFQSEKCMFTISTHGSAHSIFIESAEDLDRGILNYTQEKEIEYEGGTKVDAEEFATIIKNSSKYKENKIKHINLFSCDCGKDPEGFAQQLADLLQVVVSAFEGLALVSQNDFASGTQESRNVYTADKEIKIFYPRPQRELSEKYNIYDSKYEKSIFDE